MIASRRLIGRLERAIAVRINRSFHACDLNAPRLALVSPDVRNCPRLGAMHDLRFPETGGAGHMSGLIDQESEANDRSHPIAPQPMCPEARYYPKTFPAIR
jgi:hypothetical protein